MFEVLFEFNGCWTQFYYQHTVASMRPIKLQTRGAIYGGFERIP